METSPSAALRTQGLSTRPWPRSIQRRPPPLRGEGLRKPPLPATVITKEFRMILDGVKSGLGAGAFLGLALAVAGPACAGESLLAAQAAAKGECVFVDEEVDGAGKVVRQIETHFAKCKPGDPLGTTYLIKT